MVSIVESPLNLVIVQKFSANSLNQSCVEPRLQEAERVAVMGTYPPLGVSRVFKIARVVFLFECCSFCSRAWGS